MTWVREELTSAPIPLTGEGALESAQQRFAEALQQVRPRFQVCAGAGCLSNGSLRVLEALRAALDGEAAGRPRKRDHLLEPVSITGCHGFCAKGPVVRIQPDGLLYTEVGPEAVAELVQATKSEGMLAESLVPRDPATGSARVRQDQIPFYAHQQRVALRNCGFVDPEDIRTYLARGGYGALARALLRLTPEGVVEAVSRSRLRGRGGAGYSTGEKWRLTRDQAGLRKFIVCNAAVQEGAGIALVAGDPHAILEGMLIAGYAIGASSGYVYLRHDYSLAVDRLRRAIEEAGAWGLLGSSVLGTPFAFEVHLREGAGAFVSGEETSVLNSIQGERAVPYMRPPYPSERGLWGYPTCVNNVETLAAVPAVIAGDAGWYAGLGTSKSGGTKVLVLTGAVMNTGLVEVPLGTPLRHVVERIGGGARPGRRIKAVQVGGPTGGCIPESLLDTPLDYEDLTATGAIIGSGGMVVADDTTCMVDLAHFSLSFSEDQACGKCAPCRIGTRKLRVILERIIQGRGRTDDLDRLDQIARTVLATSLCGLGRTAPNPVLTTLRYFRDEYEVHIREQRCPAGACKALAGTT